MLNHYYEGILNENKHKEYIKIAESRILKYIEYS
jgi:hypothetical protein